MSLRVMSLSLGGDGGGMVPRPPSECWRDSNSVPHMRSSRGPDGELCASPIDSGCGWGPCQGRGRGNQYSRVMLEAKLIRLPDVLDVEGEGGGDGSQTTPRFPGWRQMICHTARRG